MTDYKAIAQAFADEHGLRVFPVNGKQPVKTVQWKRATKDASKWDKEWEDATGYGVVCDGITVIDIDDRAGFVASDQPDSFDTHVVLTQSGGMHIYAKGESTRGKFAFGDIKTGEGSYVVGPGSAGAYGTYKTVLDKPISEMPEEWDRYVGTHDRDPGGERHDPGEIVHDGEGRDDALAAQAGRLVRMGFVGNDLEQMLEVWNQNHIVPPKPPHDIKRIAESIGVKAPDANAMAAADLFAIAAKQMETGIKTCAEVATFVPKPAIIEGVFPYGTVNVMYGPPGSYKSFIALDWAKHIAAGTALPLLGGSGRFVPPRPLKVLYVAAEGIGGLTKRIRAAGMENSEVLIYDGKVDLADPEAAELLKVKLVELGIDVVFFDTFRKSAVGMEENSSGEVSKVMGRLENWTIKHDIVSVLIHHSNRGERGDFRGSSAIEGDAYNMWKVALVQGEELAATVSAEKFKDTEPINLVVNMALDEEANSLSVLAYSEAERDHGAAPRSDRMVGVDRMVVLLAQNPRLNDIDLAAEFADESDVERSPRTLRRWAQEARLRVE